MCGLSKFKAVLFCQFKINSHICNVFHLIQASRLANNLLRAFFMPTDEI